MKHINFFIRFLGMFSLAILLGFSLPAFQVSAQDPCVPANLIADEITDHSAQVAWESGDMPTWIRYAPTGDTNYQYKYAHHKHAHLDWLADNTEYTWSLNLLCNGTWTGYNVSSTFITLLNTIGCDPTNLVADEVTDHSAHLGWDGPEVPTWIRYAPTGDTNYQYRFAHHRHANLHWLADDTEYTWSLNLFCDGEWTGYNVSATFTTLLDTIGCNPTNLVSENVTDHSADLSWEGPEVPTWIRYAPIGDTNYLYRFAHHRHANLHWLADDTEYTWSLNLFCDGEWTGYNVSATFTTLETDTTACIPTDLTSQNITSTTVDLSWTGGGDKTWVRYFAEGSADTLYKCTHHQYTTLEELLPATTYIWELNSKCGWGWGSWTGYMVSSTFTTAADSAGNGGAITGIDPGDQTAGGLNQLNIYPNPGADQMNIRFISEMNESYVIRILDLTGRIVLQKEGAITKGNNEIMINASDLNRGSYLVDIKSGIKHQTIRWVKQ